jgi:DNA-binding MarR family transcriptional regulator
VQGPAARALSDQTIADEAGRDLIDLSARFAHAFLRFLDGKSGFTYPRLRVLEALHCDGPVTMRPLADSLGLSARNLTALADSLESDGLVRRVAHPTDRRATILEITDTGMVAAEESLAPRLAEISRLFDQLTPTARQRFRQALATLVEAMESGCPASGEISEGD